MSEHDKRLILRKGGNLFLEKYTDDGLVCEELNLVSPNRLHHLSCDLEDVTLEDVFLFVKKSIDFWELIIGNEIRSYTESSFVSKTEQDLDEDVLEACVLYWEMNGTKYNNEKTIESPKLGFHMTGKSKGVPTNFGFGMTSMFELKKLPLKLDKTFKIYTEDLDLFRKDYQVGADFESFIEKINHRSFIDKHIPFLSKWIFDYKQKRIHKTFEYGTMNASLFDILYGIFWELSFYGSPVDREEFFEELKERVDDIKENNSENI